MVKQMHEIGMFTFLNKLNIVNQLLNFYMHDEYKSKCNYEALIINDLINI